MESIQHHIILAICGLLLYVTPTTALPESSLAQSWLMPRSLPPTPSSNGFCNRYTIQASDTCQSVAHAYQVSVAEIETWNTGNYGWKGCNHIQQGDFICLSSGAPPMPVALPHATCGPQVPGTARPSDYSLLSSLNPCPSDQCCTSEGQCSTNSDTCTSSECISGCGVKSSSKTTTQEATTSRSTTTLKTTSTTTTTTKAKAKPITTTATTSKETTSTTTTEPTKTTPEETAAWTMAAYLGSNCDGDYFIVQGHKSVDSKCLDLRTLSSTYSETDVWCKYYTDGGFSSTSCDAITDELVFSWALTGGSCTAYADSCDDSGLNNIVVEASTCQREEMYHPHYLMMWHALKCTVNT